MAQTLEVMEFEVGGQHFGLPSLDVLEVVHAVALTPLPRAPAIIEGIFSLRGQLVPVFDLRTRFELPASPLAPNQRLLVATADRRLVALRVDDALGLRSLDPAHLTRGEAISPRLEQIAGVAALPDGLLLIHDLRSFLSQAEKAELSQSLANAGVES